ncbi:MAG: formimidoylglutamase, partial [Bacteroidetes bacterium]|nr:formimidoylglutamase [Bacteroidota bacterium]
EMYFAPVETVASNEGTLGDFLKIHTTGSFPEFSKGGVALIYVPEFRNSGKTIANNSDDRFRHAFYKLFPGDLWKTNIYDLGTIEPGLNIEDTYFAIATVCKELVKNEIIPVVIGGSQDLTYGVYQGFEQLEQLINICSVDSKLDIGRPDEPFTAQNYVSHLLVQRPCYLFNFANIGCQAPMNGKHEMELFDKLYFDYCRLGEFNTDFKRAEPHLRNSDILSVDVKSIRNSDFPGQKGQNPNGFYADQICQITRYAGISDKLMSLGIFNLEPDQDSDTAHELVAQMIWYFIEGYTQRKGDFPIGSKKEYIRFAVHMDEGVEDEIVFYKSNKSERWWMEVPYPSQNGQRYLRHHLVPCDFEDYQRSMKNEIPDLWWKTYQKLE